MKLRSLICLGASIAIGLMVGGCATPIPDDTNPVHLPAIKPATTDVAAGVPITFDDKASAFTEANARTFVARSDPFALTGPQLAFERAQSNERQLQDLGGFYEVIPPPETETAQPVLEPQPYRRLAGVVVGQSVVGIIEINGDTENQQLIRPGQLVPGTEWRVVSIDKDHAVLRRSGNTLPHEISVRLESRPFGSGNGNVTPGSGQPGTPGTGGGKPGLGGASGG